MASLFTSLFDALQDGITFNSLLSVGSAAVTGYFWLVKAQRERAGLELYHAGRFRPDRLQCSNTPGKEKATWYGEIFLANPSTLPGTVIGLRIELFWKGQWIEGTRSHREEGRPALERRAAACTEPQSRRQLRCGGEDDTRAAGGEPSAPLHADHRGWPPTIARTRHAGAIGGAGGMTFSRDAQRSADGISPMREIPSALRCASRLNGNHDRNAPPSPLRGAGSKSSRLTNLHASSAPYSRFMPASFHSTANGPS